MKILEDHTSKTSRKYGYDILVNNFEVGLRNYLLNRVFIDFGSDWLNHIPEGVKNSVSNKEGIDRAEDLAIDQFFEELYFLSLKDVIIFADNFKRCSTFLGALDKGRFISQMDGLNVYRRRIAHAKSDFSYIDLDRLIESVKLLTCGEDAKAIAAYIEKGQYRTANNIPDAFIQEYDILNNLPAEEYDLEGGFIGRERELKEIRDRILSNQDRIITISGAGGVGKTALALKTAYSFLNEELCPFEAILWFSAKNTALNDDGIIAIEPDISDYHKLLLDLTKVCNFEAYTNFEKGKVPKQSYREFLYQLFSVQPCLLIIDNLETIISDPDIIEFIKNVPRDSKVLITSRTGLGEIERRYPLPDMDDPDAVRLFRRVASQRRKQDLIRLDEKEILRLVRKVRNYPLLIKWSIGQFCLGKGLEDAFSDIFTGDSEIAKFSFNDIFSLLSEDAKLILYSMVTYGDKPVSKYVLTHLAGLGEEQFADAIRTLIISSLVYPELSKEDITKSSQYSMLTLTRGFITTKLNEDIKTRKLLDTRMYHLSEEISDTEKANTAYYQSLQSFGVKSVDEKVAFTRVKAAKNFFLNGDSRLAESNFEEAIKAAPNLSYALQEYSKFLSSTDRTRKALSLAKRAVEVDIENYHAWFNYGIMLRMSQMLDEAIIKLNRAKELNSKHLPIYNELGLAYTLRGQYDKAESEYNSALQEELMPNLRHKKMTLQFKAENYRRWAEASGGMQNSEAQRELLYKSSSVIREALDIGMPDYGLLKTYWKILLDLGIYKCNNDDIISGIEDLKKCLDPWNKGGKLIHPLPKIVALASYEIALYSLKKPKVDVEEVSHFIKMGLAHCKKDDEIHKKLRKLNDSLNQKRDNYKRNYMRKYGAVRYFDIARKFGIIDNDEGQFIFFYNGVKDQLKPVEFMNLEGKLVSFLVGRNEKTGKNDVGYDIMIEK